MLIRLIDLLKLSRINAFFTALTHEGNVEEKEVPVNAVSSLADVWINLDNEMQQNRRVRSLRVVKARGMGHETEAKRFSITNKGIIMEDVR